MKFEVVTIFPEIFDSFLQGSLLGKAIDRGLIEVAFSDPRDFTADRHRTVDDTPFGGGDGMVLKPEPWVAAIEAAQARSPNAHRVALTPAGQPIRQADLRRLAQRESLVLVCGRYEGFDERILGYVDQQLSLGDFVLNGGEVPAMALIDGIARLIPEVIGNPGSLGEESHQDGLLEYPQYTRPREFRGAAVPEVLLGGDHQKVADWRTSQRLTRTLERRPELFRRHRLSERERQLFAMPAGRVYLALVHHPVYDKAQQLVTTALTNLDLHDIARSSRTFGLGGYFVITPITAQRQLAERIVGHWQSGHGAIHNPHRQQALSLVRVLPNVASMVEQLTENIGKKPLVVGTTARRRSGQVAADTLLTRLATDESAVILMGTGWGLADELLEQCDLVLTPIEGQSGYNHLSVRSATAILLDRLFGLRDQS
ncbi:MAG: tRNA (guanosine(37)-N1)-methyltransferase TrmD [Deltaproteobacteria bacterium]|nr:tRNA (guanosine(37)-N1)-methyltransferase TrmD [Deltaproteobacteria bacterium]